MGLITSTLTALHPNLDFSIGPVQAYTGSAFDDYILNETLYWANDFMNRSTFVGMNNAYQYGISATMLREYYRHPSPSISLWNAAMKYIEHLRDATGGLDDLFNPANHANYIVTPNSELISPTTYNNPSAEQFFVYLAANPAGEAAAVRKISDLLKYLSVAYAKFHHIIDGGYGDVRDMACVINWLWHSVLAGHGAVSFNIDGGPAWTTSQLLFQAIHNLVRLKAVDGSRPFPQWGFDIDSNNSKRFIGNMNLFGTGNYVLGRVDRWMGHSDPDIQVRLNEGIQWLDTQWVPLNSAGQIIMEPGQARSGGYRYYYYPSGLYGDNGTHPFPEFNLLGHTMFAHAYSYSRYGMTEEWKKQRVLDQALNMMRVTQQINNGGPWFDIRQFSEVTHTWHNAMALIGDVPEGDFPHIVGPQPNQNIPQNTQLVGSQLSGSLLPPGQQQAAVPTTPVTVAPCTAANFAWTKVLTAPKN